MNVKGLRDGSRGNPLTRQVEFKGGEQGGRNRAASVLLRAAAPGPETKRQRQLPLSHGIKLTGCDRGHQHLGFQLL